MFIVVIVAGKRGKRGGGGASKTPKRVYIHFVNTEDKKAPRIPSFTMVTTIENPDTCTGQSLHLFCFLGTPIPERRGAKEGLSGQRVVAGDDWPRFAEHAADYSNYVRFENI